MENLILVVYDATFRRVVVEKIASERDSESETDERFLTLFSIDGEMADMMETVLRAAVPDTTVPGKQSVACRLVFHYLKRCNTIMQSQDDGAPPQLLTLRSLICG